MFRLRKTGRSQAALESEKENKALRFLLVMIALGIGTIVIFSCHMWAKGCASVLSTLFLVAGASFSIGSFIGFLFGIPRMVANTEESTVRSRSKYTGNDNLIQVSDWLTKTIVGVGLTQIGDIPEKLMGLSEKISENAGLESYSIVMLLITYFSIIGFLFGYLWTRLYFIKMLNNSDNDLDLKREMISTRSDISLIQDYLSTGAQNTQLDINDDLQKGKWGGNATVNGKTIQAEIKESNISKDYFNVSVTVSSIDKAAPLQDDVTFHLHPSFRNPTPKVKVVDGKATLNILALAPFTIGVECDNGATQLELDLSTLPNAPQRFIGSLPPEEE